MNRFFAFGCSFTNYKWPTWADILAREFNYYENWGQQGGGNSFIFYSLMECITRNKITKDDTIIIMWSTIVREDRYLKNHWVTPGCIYTQNVYSKDFVDKFADPIGYFIRDCANISAANCILKSIGCNYHFLSMTPIDTVNDYNENYYEFLSNLLNCKKINNVKKIYKKDLDLIKPSVFEVVFNCNWASRIEDLWFKTDDQLAENSREFSKFSIKYNFVRGDDWPTLAEFKILKNLDNLSPDIKSEILEIFNGKNFQEMKLNDTFKSYDHHPTPALHLEYIDKVLPYTISQKTRKWAIDGPWVKSSHEKKVKRF